MRESYFEYILSQCKDDSVSFVCSPYKTKSDMCVAAKKGFNGQDYILGQRTLLFAVIDFFEKYDFFDESRFSGDARKLYLRCMSGIKRIREVDFLHVDVDYEDLFNIMVDVNWLFASQYAYNVNRHDRVLYLLDNPSIACKNLKKALKVELFDSAYYYKDRSIQYAEATKTKYQFLPGLHPDPEVRDLVSQGATYSDFHKLQVQTQECSVRKMALFYSLTATAALIEEIRRM